MDQPKLSGLRIDERVRSGGAVRPVVYVIVVLIVVGALAGAWVAVRGGAPAIVTVAAVEERGGRAGGAATVLNASGYVTARRRATVSSKITGKVVEVHVEEGMQVKAGQVLARLDGAVFRRYLELAEAELGAAKRTAAETEVRLREAGLTLTRARALVKDGIAGQAQLDTAETEVDALKARLDLAREQVAVSAAQLALRRTEIEDMVIRAPFAGVAISKDAQPGEMISPVSAGGGFTRTGICTIVDMTSLEIEVDVNESYINRVSAGQAVEAILDAYPDWRIRAHVITVVPTADRQKATVLVRIGFEALDPRILPDMGVKVAFQGADTPASTTPAPAPQLVIPRAAIRKDAGRDVVFVAKDGTAERRAVTLGAAEGDVVTVVSGLAAGERVVVTGPAQLTDKQTIKVQ